MDSDKLISVCCYLACLTAVIAGIIVGLDNVNDRLKVLEEAGRDHGHEININLPEDWLRR